MGVVNFMYRPLCSRERTLVPTAHEAGWAPYRVWTFRETENSLSFSISLSTYTCVCVYVRARVCCLISSFTQYTAVSPMAKPVGQKRSEK